MADVPNPRAFPVENNATPSIERGMTLRDYFAAAALTGLATNPDTKIQEDVSRAYEAADLMLEERVKQ